MKQFIEQITGKMQAEDWALLSPIIERITASKGDYLLRTGKVCRSIWYLEAGAVRMFEYEEGEEHTTHFFLPPSMFTMYHSLITGKPSEVNIITETDCQLQVLPYSALSNLYDHSHKLERVGRIMAEHQFIGEFNRRRMHLNMDALERYEYLEAHQPSVFQHFQLKDIATFLGITPVSLSRLRKYRAQKK